MSAACAGYPQVLFITKLKNAEYSHTASTANSNQEAAPKYIYFLYNYATKCCK